MEKDYKKIIEKYLCTKDSGGYSIYELMKTMLLFEISYETINHKIMKKDTKNTILDSYILSNVLRIGYTYTQINVLYKLFDFDKQALSFINLWEEVKSLLPKDKKYNAIQEVLNSLKKNQILINIHTARDKIICHNDEDADRQIEIEIRESLILAFKVYKYFTSFIPNPCDFLDYRGQIFLEHELETLSLPFFNCSESKELFETSYKNVLKELGLKYITHSDLIILADSVTKSYL